jgi:hypothetical protein
MVDSVRSMLDAGIEKCDLRRSLIARLTENCCMHVRTGTEHFFTRCLVVQNREGRKEMKGAKMAQKGSGRHQEVEHDWDL